MSPPLIQAFQFDTYGCIKSSCSKVLGKLLRLGNTAASVAASCGKPNHFANLAQYCSVEVVGIQRPRGAVP